MSKLKFFAYDPDSGFELFATEAEAKKFADDAIEYYRGDAFTDGWPDEVNQVCWGRLMGESTKVNARPVDLQCDYEARFSEICDFQIVDVE